MAAVDEDLDLLQEDKDLNSGEICILCERNRPVFLVDNDDMILRLPERFLPPFLWNMKQDFLAKRPYLKFLRVNSRLIRICECSQKNAHAYCITAQVVRSQKIYCRDCKSYFHLYVKSERILSSEYMLDVLKLLLLVIASVAAIYGIYYLDRVLKGIYLAKTENDLAR